MDGRMKMTLGYQFGFRGMLSGAEEPTAILLGSVKSDNPERDWNGGWKLNIEDSKNRKCVLLGDELGANSGIN